MIKTATLLIVAFSLLLGGVAIAGDKHERCNLEAQDCLNKMSNKIKAKGWLGIETEKTESGAYKVMAVIADSPAQAAGFRAGDVLVALNGIQLSADNKEKLYKAKKSLAPAKVATYTVKRAGSKKKLAVTLGNVPSDVMAQWVGEHMVEHHATEQLAQN